MFRIWNIHIWACLSPVAVAKCSSLFYSGPLSNLHVPTGRAPYTYDSMMYDNLIYFGRQPKGRRIRGGE